MTTTNDTTTNGEAAMSDFRPRPGNFTGRHMLFIMVVFFGVIISVNLLMAVVATRSWTGLVVANSYVASQNFNDELAAGRKQADLGWQARLQVEPDAALVALTEAGAGGRPLQDFTVTLQLSRPTHENEDRLLSLGETGPGLYSAAIRLGPGVWNAELRVTSPAGDNFRQTSRFVVKPGLSELPLNAKPDR